MLDTDRIPLAAIDEVVVRQVLGVRADEKRYVSPAIGTRSSARSGRATGRDGVPELTYPDYVRDRILDLADGARRRHRLRASCPPYAAWAWPEIAGLVVTALGFVVAILV